MSPAAERRLALADFLRSRRAKVARHEIGLPSDGRGKVIGLRREEVSYLSGVSVTWYTWLEQARDIQPSREVLNAICRTMLLDEPERAYVFELAGYATEVVHADTANTAPDAVQHFLDALDPNPAYVVFHDWSISGWNAAYESLYPKVAQAQVESRNLLWMIFTDPSVRELLPDWESTSRRFIAEFRAEVGPFLDDPDVADLIARLTGESPHFREGWNSHSVELFTSRCREFNHPQLGRLVLEHHRLALSDQPHLHLVIYTPTSTEDARRLFALAPGVGHRAAEPE